MVQAGGQPGRPAAMWPAARGVPGHYAGTIVRSAWDGNFGERRTPRGNEANLRGEVITANRRQEHGADPYCLVTFLIIARSAAQAAARGRDAFGDVVGCFISGGRP